MPEVELLVIQVDRVEDALFALYGACYIYDIHAKRGSYYCAE